MEEVNSNISSKSSVWKFMKDFNKSWNDVKSQVEQSNVVMQNRMSWKILTPVRIVDYNIDDERKVKSDYASKSMASHEKDFSLI